MSPRRRLPYYALLVAKNTHCTHTVHTTYVRTPHGGNHVCLILSQGVGFLVKRPLLVQWNNGIGHRARRKTNNNGSNERPHRAFYAHITTNIFVVNVSENKKTDG